LNTITGFQVYKIYNAIKLHFNSERYNAITMRFKTKVNESSFDKRKDKYFFIKLAKKMESIDHCIHYFVAYLILRNHWIGDIIQDNGDIYKAWLSRMESLHYIYEQDLLFLRDQYDFSDLFRIETNETYPPIVTHAIDRSIHFETFSILDNLIHFNNDLKQRINETHLFPVIAHRASKYYVFLDINNKSSYRKTALKIFLDRT
jgi:hypothetical protein